MTTDKVTETKKHALAFLGDALVTGLANTEDSLVASSVSLLPGELPQIMAEPLPQPQCQGVVLSHWIIGDEPELRFTLRAPTLDHILLLLIGKRGTRAGDDAQATADRVQDIISHVPLSQRVAHRISLRGLKALPTKWDVHLDIYSATVTMVQTSTIDGMLSVDVSLLCASDYTIPAPHPFLAYSGNMEFQGERKLGVAPDGNPNLG